MIVLIKIVIKKTQEKITYKYVCVSWKNGFDKLFKILYMLI